MIVDTGYLMIFDTPTADLVAPGPDLSGLSPAAQAALAVDAALRSIKPIADVADSAPHVDKAAAHIADVSRKAFAGQLQDSQFDNGAR